MSPVVRKDTFDIVVIGGGPAGVCAAVSASRSGSKTLLIEQYGFLGGMAAAALFQPWRGFHTQGRQIVGGIGEEIVDRLKRTGGSPGHIPDPAGIAFTVTPFDIEMLKYVMQEIVVESGAHLLLHSYLMKAVQEKDRLRAVLLHCREGDVEIEGRVFVDATGDGNLAASAGSRYVVNTKGSSFRFSMSYVDDKRLVEYFTRNPHEFSASSSKNQSQFLALKGFTSLTKLWLEKNPELAATDSIEIDGTLRRDQVVVSMIHFNHVDVSDAESMTGASLRAQPLVSKAASFLVDKCPGFSGARILVTPPQVGFHSTRHIPGTTVVTDADAMSGKTVDDAIASCAIPGLRAGSFQIPRGAVQVPHLRNLLLAGRCMMPPTALFSTNNQPASMAIGEAVGKMAVECIA